MVHAWLAAHFPSDQKENAMENDFIIHFRKQDSTWMAEIKSNDQEQKNTAGVGNTPEEALKDLFLTKDKKDYQTEVRKQKQ